MNISRHNPGMTLINGETITLDSLESAKYTIRDVATVLGRKQRFNDHLPEGIEYSVAEHCYHASYLYSANPFGALMHDAPEWITGDLITPVKARVPDFREVESIVETDLVKRYGYRTVDERFKVVDDVLFQVEHATFYGRPQVYSFDVPIKNWSPKEATEKFLRRFEELFKAPKENPATW